MRDSNPRKRSQSPVCYRYTNPLFAVRSLKRIYYYTQKVSFVKKNFYLFFHFVSQIVILSHFRYNDSN